MKKNEENKIVESIRMCAKCGKEPAENGKAVCRRCSEMAAKCVRVHTLKKRLKTPLAEIERKYHAAEKACGENAKREIIRIMTELEGRTGYDPSIVELLYLKGHDVPEKLLPEGMRRYSEDVLHPELYRAKQESEHPVIVPGIPKEAVKIKNSKIFMVKNCTDGMQITNIEDIADKENNSKDEKNTTEDSEHAADETEFTPLIPLNETEKEPNMKNKMGTIQEETKGKEEIINPVEQTEESGLPEKTEQQNKSALHLPRFVNESVILRKEILRKEEKKLRIRMIEIAEERTELESFLAQFPLSERIPDVEVDLFSTNE